MNITTVALIAAALMGWTDTWAAGASTRAKPRIVINPPLIWGIGCTIEESWADFRRQKAGGKPLKRLPHCPFTWEKPKKNGTPHR